MTSQNNLTVPDFPTQSAQSQAGAELLPVQQQLDELRALLDQYRSGHHHNGSDGQPIQFDTDVRGMFEVVSSVPSGTPRNAYEQVKVYTNGTTYRLYWYDWQAHAWHYSTGT